MTDHPQSPSHGPNPSPARPDSPSGGPISVPVALRRQTIAWLVLIVSCFLMVWAGPIVGRFAPPTPPQDPVTVSSMQIEVAGRFALGARSIMGEPMAKRLAETEQLRDLSQPLDEIAKIDDEHERGVAYVDFLRATPLAAELGGADGAIERLDALLEAPGVPEGIDEDARLMRRIYAEGSGALGADERDRLIDRHGWLGRLAVSFDEPPDAPDRKLVLSEARTTFYGLMGLVGLGVVALPVGFALFIVGIILLERGRIRPRYVPDRTSPGAQHAAFLETIALFMAGLAVFSLTGAILGHANLSDGASVVVEIVMRAAQWALLLIAFWPLARGVRLRGLVAGLGWTPGRGIIREMGAGIATYLAGLPLLLVGFLLMYLLITITGITPTHPIVEQARHHDVLSILYIYAIATIWAPLVEETMFRGAFYHNLRRWLGPVASALIVAFVFAGVHPQGFVALPPLMALAFVFAMIREWRGSLVGCMTAHAMHNGILMTLNILFLAHIV